VPAWVAFVSRCSPLSRPKYSLMPMTARRDIRQGSTKLDAVVRVGLTCRLTAQNRSARAVSLATYAGQSCCSGRLETSARRPTTPSICSCGGCRRVRRVAPGRR
jgi:hypothetical protein